MSDYWSFRDQKLGIFSILTRSPAKMLGIFKQFEGLELRDEYTYTSNPGALLQPLLASL